MDARPALTIGRLPGELGRAQAELLARRLRAGVPRLAVETVPLPPARAEQAEARPFLASSPAALAAGMAALRAGTCRLLAVWAGDLAPPLPRGIARAAVLERENPFDALLHRQGLIADDLPAGATVGVLNLRARAQMQTLWPQLALAVMPGGAEEAAADFLRQAWPEGLLLPAALAEQLGIQAVVSEIFHPEVMLPSAGQGILIALGRAEDTEAMALARNVHSEATAAELEAELAFRERLAPDQDVPAGVLAQVDGKRITIVGAIASPSGQMVHRGEREGAALEAAVLGAALADELVQSPHALIDLLEADFPEGLPPADEEIDLDLDDEDLGAGPPSPAHDSGR